MKKQTQYLTAAAVAVMAVLVAGCASLPSSAELDKKTADIMQASFREQGQAKMDRLVLDDANRECMNFQRRRQHIQEVSRRNVRLLLRMKCGKKDDQRDQD